MSEHRRKADNMSGRRKKRWPRLTSDEFLLQPWFLPKRIELAIRALVPPDNYRHRMHNFFDDYGCMVCGRHARYKSNGMCENCAGAIRQKIERSAKQRLKKKSERRHDLGLIRRAKLAKKLLSSFSREGSSLCEKNRIKIPHTFNPIREFVSSLPSRFEPDRKSR